MSVGHCILQLRIWIISWFFVFAFFSLEKNEWQCESVKTFDYYSSELGLRSSVTIFSLNNPIWALDCQTEIHTYRYRYRIIEYPENPAESMIGTTESISALALIPPSKHFLAFETKICAKLKNSCAVHVNQGVKMGKISREKKLE